MIKPVFIFSILLWLTFLSSSGEDPIDLLPLPVKFDGAVSLSITPQGMIYIAEQKRHRFMVLNPNGVRVDSLGAQGSGDYRFDSPVSIQATNGLRIYVADRNNSRVQLYDRRHQYLTTITAEKVNQPGRFSPEQIVVNRSNELFIYDSERHVIYMFDSNGNFSRELDLRPYRMGSVTKMTFLESVLLILDSEKGVIHRFDNNGGYLNFIGGFSGATSIYGENEHIWAAFPDRVEKFTDRGRSIREILFNREYVFSDLSVHQNTIYLLSSQALYKASAE